MAEKQMVLQPATKEEVDAFNKDLEAIIEKHGMILRAVPIFVPDDNFTGKFVADAHVAVFKKPNGKPATETPETKEEAQAD